MINIGEAPLHCMSGKGPVPNMSSGIFLESRNFPLVDIIQGWLRSIQIFLEKNKMQDLEK
jgi:hypothetical protein